MLIIPVSPTGSNDPWSVAARFSLVDQYRKTVKIVTLEKVPGRWSRTSGLDIPLSFLRQAKSIRGY